MIPSSLLLVGCGKMGGALLARWQQTHPCGITRFKVIEPVQRHADTEHVKWFADLASLPTQYTPDIVVFAVKPQQLADLLPLYRERFREKLPLYISIAAGKAVRFFMAHLGEHARVVRAMPNLPALMGQGVTVLVGSPALPASAKSIATQLMESVGHVLWTEDESKMDAVTAISGSGPAYVFLFLDALAKAGVAAGLPADMARSLAIETVAGSCSLARSSHENLEILRKNVTSPGGTTEAALSILMKEGALEKLLAEAVDKATRRSSELAE